MTGGLLGQAVVVGAGVAGLAAAGVLSRRFARVTVVERDLLPDDVRGRPGVPQEPHVHGLLAVGREAFEDIFPGLTDDLFRQGASEGDVAAGALIWLAGGWRSRSPSGVHGIGVTRLLLETCLRRHVQALPNVEFRTGTAVSGLVTVGAGRVGGEGELVAGDAGLVGGDVGRVGGVVLDGVGRLDADLVVDATGRAGRSDGWLRELGFPTPAASSVTVRIGYASQLRRRRPDDLPGDAKLTVITQSSPAKRLGVAMAVDGDRWLVTLAGYHGDHPPADQGGFDAFADTLPSPLLADLLARAEPLTDIAVCQFPASRRRHFEHLRRPPAGYVAIGDALCSFNPVYGQGMTVAAQEAVELGHWLDRYGAAAPDMVRDFYRRAARIVAVPWELARGTDFVHPETRGPKPAGLALRNRYMRYLARASHVSPEVNTALLKVQHLLAPPSTLIRPGTVVRAMRAARQPRATGATAAVPDYR